MLRKIHLRAPRTTQPKLLAAGKHLVVTWNTGGIDRCATRKEQAWQARTRQETMPIVACVLLALLIVGLLIVGVILARGYAML